MGLYLPEWIGGYEYFMDFGYSCWMPEINLSRNGAPSGHVYSKATLFDPIPINALADELSHPLNTDFIKRFQDVNTFMFDMLKIREFISKNLTKCVESNNDLDDASFEITQLFKAYLTDFEFWGQLDIVELYANLLFYGSLTYPRPVVFFIPPMSEWDKYPHGFEGYYPFDDGFDGDE